MRLLEIRRHARRQRPAQHLIRRGVEMAHTLGEQLGPFDLVVTSPLPRCVETAVAMGFAVDRDCPELAGVDGLGESVPGLPDDFDWDEGYAGFGPGYKPDPKNAKLRHGRHSDGRGQYIQYPFSPFGIDSSSRILPTYTSSLPAASRGVGYIFRCGSS